MSFALLVVGSVACLLVLFLLGSLALVSRVERRHEEAVGVRTEDRPDRAGTSGDLHLFLAFAEDGLGELAALAQQFQPTTVVAPAAYPHLIAALRERLPDALRGHAEYGHFRKIRASGVAGAVLVYLQVRTRRPVQTMLDAGERPAWARTLSSLAALGPEELVEVTFELARPSTDPAAGRPVPLRDE